MNKKLAVKITAAVGSMQCAYLFAGIALVGLLGLFGLLPPIFFTLMTWFSQQFLQLVLLSVILLGQNITSEQQQAKLERALKHLEKQEAKQLDLERKLIATQHMIAGSGQEVRPRD